MVNATDLSVPVVIDDVKNIEGFEMTRCAYFEVEADEPTLGFGLAVDGVTMPILLVGLAAVIIRPLGDAARFETADQIDELFDVLEANDTVRIETADIWLPNFLLAERGDAQERGNVYRLGAELFNHAHRHWDGRLGHDQYIALCRDLGLQCEYAPEETRAFKAWTVRQVEVARENYAQQRERDQVLPWRRFDESRKGG